MEFSGQEYWSGLSFPIPGDRPNSGIEPVSCVFCIGRQFLHTCTTWETHLKKLLFLLIKARFVTVRVTLNQNFRIEWSHVNKIHIAYIKWCNKINWKPRNFGVTWSSLNSLPSFPDGWISWYFSVSVFTSQLDSLRHELMNKWSALSLEQGQTAGRVTVPLTSHSRRLHFCSNPIHVPLNQMVY